MMISSFYRKLGVKNKSTMWKKTLGRKGKFSFYHNSRGAAALCNDKFDVIWSESDMEGRLAVVLLELGDKKIGFVSVYMPNLNGTQVVRDTYLQQLLELDRICAKVAAETDMLVIGGDFNIIMDPALDAEKVDATIYPDILSEVYDLMEKYNLIDVYREFNPSLNTYTYSPKGTNPHGIFRRLDYIMVSESILTAVEDVKEKFCYFSDHKALSIKIKFGQLRTKNRNYLRHNDNLL